MDATENGVELQVHMKVFHRTSQVSTVESTNTKQNDTTEANFREDGLIPYRDHPVHVRTSELLFYDPINTTAEGYIPNSGWGDCSRLQSLLVQHTEVPDSA